MTIKVADQVWGVREVVIIGVPREMLNLEMYESNS